MKSGWKIEIFFPIQNLILNKEGGLFLNFEDDLVKGCCITHDGKIIHDKVS